VTPQYDRALQDVYSGVSNWLMWGRLGWLEIRRRYRRTFLGPFWTAFNIAVMVFSIGFLWAALFDQPVGTYMPYLTASVIVWQFMSTCMNEGATVFTAGTALITTMRISQTLLVVTMVWRNLLVFLHNLMIFVVVVLIWHVPVNWHTLLAVPGLVLLALNGLWVAILLGLVSTRFRDVPQLLSGLVTVLMFLTPVMWSRDILKGREAIAYVIDYNPFYYAIEVVRTPLLGQAPSLTSWLVMFFMIPLGAAFTLYIFSRFRQRVAYWL
jgi:ABC-type polysaccharide/polyol phosphate export permease